MTQPRGFIWCEYLTDDGYLFALQVDAGQAGDPYRGWQQVLDFSLRPLPRGWRPREVYGIDEVGYFRRARIGRTDAALWTGSVTQWNVEGTDQQMHTAVVLGRRSEQVKRRPHA